MTVLELLLFSWTSKNSVISRIHTCTWLFMSYLHGVQIRMFGPVGSKVISSEMGLRGGHGLFSFPRSLIKIEISRVWPGVSVVTNRSQQDVGMRVMKNPESLHSQSKQVAFQTGVENWPLHPCCLMQALMWVWSAPLHRHTFLHRDVWKWEPSRCDCGGPWKDPEIFSTDVTTSSKCSVVLEMDYFFSSGSLGVIALKVYALVTTGCALLKLAMLTLRKATFFKKIISSEDYVQQSVYLLLLKFVWFGWNEISQTQTVMTGIVK